MRQLLLCLALAGCTQVTAAQNQVITFTQDDVANALAKAQAAGPSGAELVPCLTFIKSQIPSVQTSTTTPNTIGVATAFVAADLALGQVSGALGTGAQSSFETACGPLWLHIVNQGMTVSSQIAALAALMAKP